MKRLLFTAVILLGMIVTMMPFTSCQRCTRQWGGTTKIELEPGEKLVEATWKNNSIWYLVEPMESDYVPKTKVFKERSNTRILEGDVIFVERR